MSGGNVRLFPHTADHLQALWEGAPIYEARYGVSLADGVREFLGGPEVSADFRARLETAAVADPWRDGNGVLLLAENRVIGLASFNGPPDADGAAEISYAIASAYTGRGYASAAARLLIEQARASGQVRTIRAHTLPEASASTRILEKCGFKNCGAIVDPEEGPIWRWELPLTR